ncbi:hypothetical protein Nepgr_028359 [Nepenthes gracilis]|uniref:Uncharacterized protein n=1 Tax=Nepenthes gracilis TaxID=150966 RepID=A0AAD3TCB5_NEPGR|nr:hypothetical protein Nepgr_028359 [Nepenthes gracilis]
MLNQHAIAAPHFNVYQLNDHNNPIQGTTVLTTNTFVTLQKGDESYPSDGGCANVTYLDSLSCEKGREPPIAILPAMERVVTVTPTLTDMQPTAPIYTAFQEGNKSGSLNVHSVDTYDVINAHSEKRRLPPIAILPDIEDSVVLISTNFNL